MTGQHDELRDRIAETFYAALSNECADHCNELGQVMWKHVHDAVGPAADEVWGVVGSLIEAGDAMAKNAKRAGCGMMKRYPDGSIGRCGACPYCSLREAAEVWRAVRGDTAADSR